MFFDKLHFLNELVALLKNRKLVLIKKIFVTAHLQKMNTCVRQCVDKVSGCVTGHDPHHTDHIEIYKQRNADLQYSA